MVRLGKLTDYGLVLMTCIARDQGHPCALPVTWPRIQIPAVHGQQASQRAFAERPARIPSRHQGRLHLGQEPREISVVEMIAAIEGPMALTECSTEVTGLCNLEPCCPIKSNQQIINQAVRGVLDKITLSDLITPMHLTSIKDTRGRIVPTIASGRIQ